MTNQYQWLSCVYLGVRDIGLRLGKQDLEKAFKDIDKDNSGSINFDEFLVRIRGDTLNKKRTALVERAFNKLDQNGNGTIEIDDLKVGSSTTSPNFIFKSGIIFTQRRAVFRNTSANWIPLNK